MDTMTIDYLADHRDVIATLARWHHDEWVVRTPNLTIADRIARFEARLGRMQVPSAFVALVDGKVAGCACLVDHDMGTRESLTPWLATVLVGPRYRRRGIGSALSERVAQEACALGNEKLWLFTFDKISFYSRLGWVAVERAEYLGGMVTIMVRDLAA